MFCLDRPRAPRGAGEKKAGKAWHYREETGNTFSLEQSTYYTNRGGGA